MWVHMSLIPRKLRVLHMDPQTPVQPDRSIVTKIVVSRSNCLKGARSGPSLLRVLHVVPRILGSKMARGVAWTHMHHS